MEVLHIGDRGASSGLKKAFSLGGNSESEGKTIFMDPGKLQNEMKSKSQIGGLETFIEKHQKENIEYYAVINSKGTVMQYNKGDKSSVSGRFRDNQGRFYQADKGSFDIHNHPSGVALPSSDDLSTWAKTNEINTSFIVGKSGHITAMAKTKNFNSKKFETDIASKKITFKSGREYLNFLSSNQNSYGYKLSSTYIKGGKK